MGLNSGDFADIKKHLSDEKCRQGKIGALMDRT
jgi:hypothetical protein